jgi:hypothetical protein
VTEPTHNQEVEATELELWGDRPDSFMAYYDLVSDHRTHGIVTTWLGTQIGIVTDARVYPHNFGARMVSVKVTGDNGATYYGHASYDNGNCIRLRKTACQESR